VRAVLFDGSGEIEARSLIVATGVSYRRLEAAGLGQLTGRGVYVPRIGAYAGELNQVWTTLIFRPCRAAGPGGYPEPTQRAAKAGGHHPAAACHVRWLTAADPLADPRRRHR
jgi:hypothetical protein